MIPLNPNIVFDRIDKKIEQINCDFHKTAKQDKDMSEDGKENDKSLQKSLEPITRVNSYNDTTKLIEQMDAMKRLIVDLQNKVTKLESETITKKRNTKLTKITPSRILTSNECIEDAKKIKEKRKDKVKNVVKEASPLKELKI